MAPASFSLGTRVPTEGASLDGAQSRSFLPAASLDDHFEQPDESMAEGR